MESPSKQNKLTDPEQTSSELNKLNLLKREFDIARAGQFDESRLRELFAFDLDKKGKSKLITMLKMVKGYRDVHVRPGGLTLLRLHHLLSTGKLGTEYRDAIRFVLGGLFQAIIRSAERGDDQGAKEQLEALKKIAQPELYDLGRERISQIARSPTKDWISRALEMREIMQQIAWVLEPKDGKRLRANTKVAIKKDLNDSQLEECFALFPSLADIEGVRAHLESLVKSNPSLKTVTCKIFLQRLHGEEIIEPGELGDSTKSQRPRNAFLPTERSLSRDLDNLEQWERTVSGWYRKPDLDFLTVSVWPHTDWRQALSPTLKLLQTPSHRSIKLQVGRFSNRASRRRLRVADKQKVDGNITETKVTTGESLPREIQLERPDSAIGTRTVYVSIAHAMPGEDFGTESNPQALTYANSNGEGGSPVVKEYHFAK